MQVTIPNDVFENIVKEFAAHGIEYTVEKQSSSEILAKLKYKGKTYSLNLVPVKGESEVQGSFYYISEECENDIGDFTNTH